MDRTEIQVISITGDDLFTYKSNHVPQTEDVLHYQNKVKRVMVKARVRRVAWILNEYNNNLHKAVLTVQDMA